MKMEDREDTATSVSSVEDLDSPFPDSPLPLESPLINPMDSPLVKSSSSAALVNNSLIKITVSPSENDNSCPAGKEGDGKTKETTSSANVSPVSSIGVAASILKVKTELREAGESTPHRKDMINSLQILGLVSGCLWTLVFFKT